MLSSLTTRWRAQYSKLPPALQMIGLQMWLPIFFMFMFCFCYLGAFHSPKIHDAPVAVVNSPAASQFTDRFGQASPGMFDFRFVQDQAEATEAVRDGSAAAAVTFPTTRTGAPEVTIASAHQFQAAQLMKSTFTTAFTQAGTAPKITDIAPLPSGDSYGMGAMYLMLSWCIGGYMVAMFIGMMGNPLSHLTRVGILAGGALVASVITNLLASLVIGVYDSSHIWQLMGISFLWILAIGLAVNGLAYFFGRFVTAIALTMFVFLSIPSSGAAYPVWMVPRLFGDLNPLVVGHGITEMIKRVLYGVGEPYWQPFLLMAGYAVLGIVTMLVGKRWRESKEFDRILAGKTTMMAAAQGAMMQKGMADRERILTAHGLDKNAEPIEDDADDTGAADGAAGDDAHVDETPDRGDSPERVELGSRPSHYTVADLESDFGGDPMLGGNGLGRSGTGGALATDELEHQVREMINRRRVPDHSANGHTRH
ncbi:ABC transporter permease [Williamsia deligens]|uniref:ABC transporter permease n=1 Tax=Williamsia deligens TaxID=321325 RepID=A0ABW3GCE5_9NOCA|nr:ABC transporter permease [Williamsia deligens]MCP2192626.1 ABC-2 family transporter protein [Williamsia deligens]